MPTSSSRIGWRPTWAHARAIVVGLLGVLTAVTFHRPDLLVAVTPLVVIAAWGVATRPAGNVEVTSRVGRRTLREGQATHVTVTVAAPAGAQEFSASNTATPWVETGESRGVRVGLVDPDDPVLTLELVARMTRWGQHELGPVVVGGLSSWGAYQWGPFETETHQIDVTPSAPVFDAVAPMPHPRGLIGIDRSARPGDGSEFASIRPFQLGDRLRRIHWPSSLRSRTINVTATYADQDSQVVVVVDASSDVGTSGGIDGAPSTLDQTVRAAAALCEHYVRRGDRVGLYVTGATRAVWVRPATGRLHLRRMLASLTSVRSGWGDTGEPEPRTHVDAGALMLMCSPLISARALQRAASLARRGLTTVVVDTLPLDLEHDRDADSREQAAVNLAWRIRMLERDTDVRRVMEMGVPVVPWRGPGSLDQVLRDVARRARAPRPAAR